MSQATFTCIDCLDVFVKTGRNQKRCDSCRKDRQRKLSYEHAVSTGRIQKPGVGSGGDQPAGPTNSLYSSGIGFFIKYRKVFKRQVRYCNRCGKDLIDASRYEWCVHHIDHNRDNNPTDFSNWELLCKACHQDHHHDRDGNGMYVKLKVQRLSRKGVRLKR